MTLQKKKDCEPVHSQFHSEKDVGSSADISIVEGIKDAAASAASGNLTKMAVSTASKLSTLHFVDESKHESDRSSNHSVKSRCSVSSVTSSRDGASKNTSELGSKGKPKYVKPSSHSSKSHSSALPAPSTSTSLKDASIKRTPEVDNRNKQDSVTSLKDDVLKLATSELGSKSKSKSDKISIHSSRSHSSVSSVASSISKDDDSKLTTSELGSKTKQESAKDVKRSMSRESSISRHDSSKSSHSHSATTSSLDTSSKKPSSSSVPVGRHDPKPSDLHGSKSHHVASNKMLTSTPKSSDSRTDTSKNKSTTPNQSSKVSLKHLVKVPPGKIDQLKTISSPSKAANSNSFVIPKISG